MHVTVRMIILCNYKLMYNYSDRYIALVVMTLLLSKLLLQILPILRGLALMELTLQPARSMLWMQIRKGLQLSNNYIQCTLIRMLL